MQLCGWELCVLDQLVWPKRVGEGGRRRRSSPEIYGAHPIEDTGSTPRRGSLPLSSLL